MRMNEREILYTTTQLEDIAKEYAQYIFAHKYTWMKVDTIKVHTRNQQEVREK